MTSTTFVLEVIHFHSDMAYGWAEWTLEQLSSSARITGGSGPPESQGAPPDCLIFKSPKAPQKGPPERSRFLPGIQKMQDINYTT